MTEKRKRITDKILEIVKCIDTKDNYNYKKYKEMFDVMTDKEFGDFCNWCNDPNDLDMVDHTIFIQALPFEEPPLANIYKALDLLGVPAEECVTFDINGDGERVKSRYKVPVGYVHIKRLEQLLSKKNKYSIDNEERSIKTDQVSGESKVGAISDVEAGALLAQGADKIFTELYKGRSSNEKVRNELYKDIALNGYATLENIENAEDPDTRNALNTFDTYLLSAGIRTDLRTDSLKLPYTIKKDLENKK